MEINNDNTFSKDASSLLAIAERETRIHAKKILEALLFASSEPLSLQKLKEILDSYSSFSLDVIREMLAEMRANYNFLGSAFQLYEIAGGFLLRTAEIYKPYVQKLHGAKRIEKLSGAAMEVLAIIAYKQPITRSQVESIRGVDSSNSIGVLLERDLIEQIGKAELPGRPTLYGTTQRFLKHFGINSLNELSQFSGSCQ